MKVSLAIKYLGDLTGGAERNVVDLANALANFGVNVSIITFEDSDSKPAFELSAEVKIINSKRSKVFHSPATKIELSKEQEKRGSSATTSAELAWYERTFPMRLAYERALSAEMPDVIITFLPHTTTYILEQVSGKYPIIVTNQNDPIRDYFDENRHDPDPFDRKKRIELLDRAEVIQVLMDNFILKFPVTIQRKCITIPNTIPALLANPAEKTESLFVAVGRLVPQKGFMLLIDAMADLVQVLPSARLRIFGEGPEAAALRLRIREKRLQRNVLLMGATNQPLKEMSASPIFVIPSEYEGWGLTLSEAMSISRGCIGFKDCAGVNWLLESPDRGILVEERSAAALADAMMKLATEPETLADLAINAQTWVRKFDPQTIYTRWLELIRATALKVEMREDVK